MKRISRSYFLGLVVCLPFVATAQEKQRFSSMEEALQASAILSGRQGPRNVNWIEGGARFSYTDRDPRTGTPLIRVYDPPTGKDAVLFTTTGVTFPGTNQPFAYDSFEWAQDSKHLVFQTNFRPLYRRSGISDYYIYSLADRSMQLATKDARTGELSPSGAMFGFERDGDMYVTNLANHQEKRLTRDASQHVYNGHFDWVYEEEFGLAQAWKWSTESRYIAYWQLDDSAEPEIQISDYSGLHQEWQKLRIPQVGDSNATVRIGVVNVATGQNTWLDTGERGEFYIPRIYWTSRADTLAVITLNRPQNLIKLFFFDVRMGGRRQVMTETSKTWIDVYDFYAGVDDMMSFPANSHEFFWLSDRDGYQHLYRYDYSGELVNQVTRGSWNAARVEGSDAKSQTIYYTSTEASPLQRQLYSIRFDGTNQRRITTTEGHHRINMSPGATYFIDRYSSLKQPTQVELWTAAGEKLRTMESNTAVTTWLATHTYSPTEIFSFTTSDGAHIDGSIVKPIPFDPNKRYPVVFDIYGGPGSQQVYDQFASNGWTQWLAQQGYIVVDLNTRGSNNYGSAFMKVVYKQLGKYETLDFAEAARYLGKQTYVDPKRVAIVGTSYGGYSAVLTMELYPELFPVGVANSAVGDWRLYDTIYTERYMSLLNDNLSGYIESAPIEQAPKLRGNLLLIHSMMDDNVHPQNTMQLLTALTNAGRDADLRIYPPGRHGAAYNGQSARLIHRVTDEYLRRYLKADNPPTLVPAR
ncbi:MAG: DPP IV N-terminal domain-containing protein [Gemmatimonadota bacterium]|nr:DPP IV N-terminal domain-containing protein [Gemmatimonadota bacterium]